MNSDCRRKETGVKNTVKAHRYRVTELLCRTDFRQGNKKLFPAFFPRAFLGNRLSLVRDRLLESPADVDAAAGGEGIKNLTYRFPPGGGGISSSAALYRHLSESASCLQHEKGHCLGGKTRYSFLTNIFERGPG